MPDSAAGCQPNSPFGSVICENQVEAALGALPGAEDLAEVPQNGCLDGVRRGRLCHEGTQEFVRAIADRAEDCGAYPGLRAVATGDRRERVHGTRIVGFPEGQRNLKANPIVRIVRQTKQLGEQVPRSLQPRFGNAHGILPHGRVPIAQTSVRSR